MPRTGQQKGDPGAYNPYSMPPGLQKSQDRRWQLATQRRQQDIGGVYRGKETALQRQAAKSGFLDQGEHGRQAFSLASAGAAEGTQALRDIEAERAKEELTWAQGERQYQQTLGTMEAGYGYNKKLQDAKADLDLALQEGRLSHEEYQNELDRLQETFLQESQQNWQSGESEDQRAHELAMAGDAAELQKYLQEQGLTSAEAIAEADRLFKYAELEQQQGLQNRQLDIEQQGLEYEHERGLLMAGIEQQKANDIRDLQTRGYDIEEARIIVEDEYNRWAKGEDIASAYGLKGMEQIHEMAMFDKQFDAEMEKSIATLMAETYAAWATGAYDKGDVAKMEQYVKWLQGGMEGDFNLFYQPKTNQNNTTDSANDKTNNA